ncbi:MAG TPA: histidine kinase dimerization/phospho-acceptor domain-containing protein, partial [Pyrinomonadaceae bacterium]|nr:histidine kinase dimerization/phospho-acceptor domain-containing protein [Pyrinomonadaceae bacterium]
MSPLEVLQLVGYSIGAVVPLWLGAQLVSRRKKLKPLERVLFALALSMGGWHASNLVITLHGLFGFGYENWTTLLRVADTVAVVSITVAYSFLLHVHLHFWANASGRGLTRSEKLRVYLSYIPTLFLIFAVPQLWTGSYAPMFVKLAPFVLPFAFWIAYVLGLIAITELLIARKSESPSERRIMRTLAASFIAVGIVILAALAFGLGEGTTVGLYLRTIANLGSLLPSVLLAYYIYRYRYLELIIEGSLVFATFAAVVLAIYLYGIRTIGNWMTAQYGVREGVIEAILILALALAAAPLRGWLEKRFHRLFDREATLYREIVERIGSHGGQYQKLPELLNFVEERTAQALELRRVTIAVQSPNGNNTYEPVDDGQPADLWIQPTFEALKQNGWEPIEDDPALTSGGYRIAYPLRREDRVSGLLLIDASMTSLTLEARTVLGILAGQIAIAIEDSRLVEENVRLERRLADRERLAALGQMAAAVAHEIKNPLSAIKSIAQVMREDETLSVDYARDLSLIVGETDRLNQSVTQLLSFARKEAPIEPPLRVDELARSVIDLFQASAREQEIELTSIIETDAELSGNTVPAVRDALSNLLLNALQATTSGGQ